MGWLFLARHASTAASETARNLGGRSDLPLTDGGRAAARALGTALLDEFAELQLDTPRMISSSALRARETLALVAEVAGWGDVVSETEPALIELDYGEWDGLTAEECARRDPELRAAWERDPAGTRCPGGESGADVAARSAPIFDALAQWLAESVDRSAVVVAHNHVNRLHISGLCGWPMSEYRWRIEQSPGAYSAIGYAERGPAIRRLNAPPSRGAR